ncbi:MAG: AAA family ATPase [Methanobrevibacter sp.]|nr:AAA family ATPase [Methanobrevibacter sp.]
MDIDERDALDDFLNKQITEMPITINEELKYKNQKFNHRNDFDEITPIIDDFLDGENINRYIVLPGLRGVGKTTILYQIYEYLQTKNISPNQILYISCDDINRMMKCDIFKVVEYYLEEFHNSTLRTLDKEIFLLIDESHFDKNWSQAGKLIYDKTKKIFMVFTGSSAIKLEYDEEASRRMLKNTICPLNYSQHLKLKYNYDSGNISDALFNLLFTSDITESSKLENKIQTDLLTVKNYTTTDWTNILNVEVFQQ